MTKHLWWSAAAALVLSACGLLDTTQPGIIEPGSLDNYKGAVGKRIGAIANFSFAQDGDGSFDTDSTDGVILTSGLMADEFTYVGPNPTPQEFNQHAVARVNGSLEALYFYVHKARISSERAAVALETYTPDRTVETGIPEVLSLAGFTYITLAENWCSGVPLSYLQADTVVLTGSDSTAGALNKAVERFDSALAHPAVGVNPNLQYLAQVGKARALVDLGQFDAAATAVNGVPTEFSYVTEHSGNPPRLQNAIWSFTTTGLFSVADSSGGTGLGYRTLLDPRVPYDSTGDVGLDLFSPLFLILKYPQADSPIPVASGIEARLIEAEAQLHDGNVPGMNAILNDLRANAISPALDSLPVPAAGTAAEDQLFSERALWLYATGHRLGDMRRLVRQYGRPRDSVFPTGPFFKGGNYGTDVNFPIPISEDQNPHFTGCQNLDP
ncbi:MAG TPA: hypothetical protein VMJ30_02575 [Gemmatimonadales bacterium]|nr:hypothetical protein [Gemmatimonadales bacterium]